MGRLSTSVGVHGHACVSVQERFGWGQLYACCEGHVVCAGVPRHGYWGCHVLVFAGC